MRAAIIDIEADGLSPTVIWVAVLRDIQTGDVHVFRRPDLEPEPFLACVSKFDCLVGHNILAYDFVHIKLLVPGFVSQHRLIDTLVISRLLHFNRDGGHSLKAWGLFLGLPKGEYNDWSRLTEEMVEYCIQDVHVCYKLYETFLPYLNAERWKAAIETEHYTAQACVEMHNNGFHFDIDKCTKLRYNILEELGKIDETLSHSFAPKVRFVREITPRLTKFGTLNKSDFRWVRDGNLSSFNGGPFSLIEFEDFNPGSPSQIVERMNDAGWKPVEKTKGHLTCLRDLKFAKDEETRTKLSERLEKYKVSGWTVSEENLKTLPDTAPPAAKTLARRIMLASRARTLLEWIENYNERTHRIHGTFNPIGAWTHRMSHTEPNTGNIPREDALFGMEMRSMWTCAPSTYLVGVDAEGIQLRVLAHYINDDRFTHSVIAGKKEDGTDPHSLNKKALGSPCKSRNDAKTFIYAWLLGAGIGKVGQILGCSLAEAKQANSDFIEFYPGLAQVKKDQVPFDAGRGYFEGFDGRYVGIVGEDQRSREHFALAGYLQNGETIVMKRAMQIWKPRLEKERIPFKIVNFVHDEWQTEVAADHDTAEYVATVQAEAIKLAGEDLNLRCPMAGAIMNGHGKLAVGQNWLETH